MANSGNGREDSDDSEGTRGTDEDADFVDRDSESADEDDEDDDQDQGKTNKRRRFGVRPPQPAFGPGSNEINPANVVRGGRRGSAASTSLSTPSTSKTTARQRPGKTTATKKRGREAARAELQSKKKTRTQEPEEPMSAAQVKKQNKAAKETATARAKMWRTLVLLALEDRRGKLSAQDLFQWVLGDKLASTAMWFADLGMDAQQVRFNCMV